MIWLVLGVIAASVGAGAYAGGASGAVDGGTVGVIWCNVALVRPYWPRRTATGTRQRVIAVIELAAVSATAYVVGWRWGALAAWLVYAVCEGAARLVLTRTLDTRGLAMEIVADVAPPPTVQQLFMIAAGVIPYTDVDQLVLASSRDARLLPILDRYDIWKDELAALHDRLVRAGGARWIRGRQVAALALTSPEALELCLCSKQPATDVVAALVKHFDTGAPLPDTSPFDADVDAAAPAAARPTVKALDELAAMLGVDRAREDRADGWQAILSGAYGEGLAKLEAVVATLRARCLRIARGPLVGRLFMLSGAIQHHAVALVYLAQTRAHISDDAGARLAYYQATRLLELVRGFAFAGIGDRHRADSLLAACLMNLALLAHANHRKERAVELAWTARNLAESTDGATSLAVFAAHLRLANMLQETGHSDVATVELARARRTLAALREPPAVNLVALLGVLEAKAERDPLAALERIAALELAALVPSLRFTVLSQLARARASAGRHDDAHAAVLRCFDELEHDRAAVFACASAAQRTAYLRDAHAVTRALVAVTAGAADERRVAAVFDRVLRNKAIGAEVMAFESTYVASHAPELASLRARAIELGALIARRELMRPGRNRHASAQVKLWQDEQASLQAELARHLASQFDERFAAIDCTRCARALGEGRALIEYLRVGVGDDGRYVAFVLADGLRLVDLGGAPAIEEAIRGYLALAQDGDATRDVGGTGRSRPMPGAVAAAAVAVRAAVFDPLVAVLGDRRNLVVAPDGLLARLPLEVLPVADGYLTDRYVISYVVCGRDVLRFGAAVASRSPAMVVGDPDFDLARAADTRLFRPLAGAREEAIAIAAQLGVPPILGGDALEGRLKRELHGPRVLHLATHGFYLQDRVGQRTRLSSYDDPALSSGVALAGANCWARGEALPDEAEDGILTAADVACLDLQGSELVVLSACQTGLGVIELGEGVTGLRAAFLAAGARTLVASLWPVDDAATRELMLAFYRELRDGTPRAEALARARGVVRATRQDPRLWGAFVCIGDPGPLA